MSRLTAIAVLCCSLGLMGFSQPLGTNGSGVRRQAPQLIAFSPYPKGGISVVTYPGGKITSLTTRHGAPWYFGSSSPPIWSPDGRWIAFLDSRNVPKSHRCLVDDDFACPSEIYAIRPDGSGEHRITKPAEGTGYPVWSPDSARLVFTKDDGKLYVINSDGTGEHRLTHHRGAEHSPSWSPDGKRIIYTDFEEIYIVDAAGGQPSRLTDTRVRRNGGPFHSPSWSPNGKWIAYAGYKPYFKGFTRIHVTDRGGHSTRVLTPPNRPLLSSYAWSPEGDRIVYDAGPEADEKGLWIIDVPTGAQRRVVGVRGLQSWNEPSWSPAGDKLVAGFSVSGNPHGIWVMNIDGTARKQIVPRGISAHWQPGR